MEQTPYEAESVLQELLERHPQLLRGDLMGHDAPRQFIIVSREISLVGEERGVGRIDHVFLDQEGIPTLVEVKRSSDTRIRREVVGQMLDYAANAVRYWPVEDVRARFEMTCAQQGIDPDERLAPVLGDEAADGYWARVGTNLKAGRLRLLFVADEISVELARIIQFLNEQMTPAEVLGVEVRQYVNETTGSRSLVPHVIGLTPRSRDRDGGNRRWDEQSFFEAIANSPTEAEVARRILMWANDVFPGIRWGYGKSTGSFYPRLFARSSGSLFVVQTNGTLLLRVGVIRTHQPYTEASEMAVLRETLGEIPGWEIPASANERWDIAMPLAPLADPQVFEMFTGAMEDAAQRIWDTQ